MSIKVNQQFVYYFRRENEFCGAGLAISGSLIDETIASLPPPPRPFHPLHFPAQREPPRILMRFTCFFFFKFSRGSRNLCYIFATRAFSAVLFEFVL